MIKLNLLGTSRQKAKAEGKIGTAINALPVVLALIVGGCAVGGYLWYSGLAAQIEELTTQNAQLEAQKAQLDAIIKQDAIFEERKKTLENRINIIERLKRDQVSPVVSLDALSQAINRTEYVWLASLDQNNTLFSMSGTSTSVNALADFVTNLENTGYFSNINLVNAQDASGNFTFSLTCEFLPSAAAARLTVPPAPASGN